MAEDWTIFISNRHTIDAGNVYVDPTHTTRDGFPMEVHYDPTIGYLVAIYTGNDQ
jgi:hypothetical protein